MARPNPARVVSTSLRPDSRGRLAIRVRCPTPAGLCDGRLAVSAGRIVLGRAAFVIRGGTIVPVRVTVSQAVLKRVANKKRVTVSILSRDNAGTAALTSKNVKFAQRRAAGGRPGGRGGTGGGGSG
jgi:hypothetical protein